MFLKDHILTLIIGLPGSGKTYISLSMDQLVIDDIKSKDELPPVDYDDDFTVIDPYFCDKKILNMSLEHLMKTYPNHSIRLIYFENNPEAAKENVVRRNDGRRVFGLIDYLSKIYDPPRTARKIYRGE